jgi:glutathione S-transferase
MNRLVGVTDSYLMADVGAGISFPRLVAPRVGLPLDEARVARCLPRAGVCIGEVARLLGNQRFMAGDALSIADLMLAPHLDYFAQTPEGRRTFADHPGLAAWLERMRTRPSMAATTWDRLRAGAAAAWRVE